jgi:hypothetical protein
MKIALVAALLAIAAAPVDAQGVTDPTPRAAAAIESCLPDLIDVPPGRLPAELAAFRVRVTASAFCRRPVAGWLLTSGDPVIVGVGGGRGVAIPLEHVTALHRSGGRSAGRGAWYGAGLGVAVGVVCVAVCQTEGGVNFAPVSFGFGGALVGALLLRPQRWEPLPLQYLGEPVLDP